MIRLDSALNMYTGSSFYQILEEQFFKTAFSNSDSPVLLRENYNKIHNHLQFYMFDDKNILFSLFYILINARIDLNLDAQMSLKMYVVFITMNNQLTYLIYLAYSIFIFIHQHLQKSILLNGKLFFLLRKERQPIIPILSVFSAFYLVNRYLYLDKLMRILHHCINFDRNTVVRFLLPAM